jgi:hypothetical protein
VFPIITKTLFYELTATCEFHYSPLKWSSLLCE